MHTHTATSRFSDSLIVQRFGLQMLAAAALAMTGTVAQAAICAAGTYQSAPGVCTISPLGTYSPGGTSAPILAPAGKYIPITGATSAAAAIAAPLGYYVPTAGASAPTIAPKGYYVPVAGATAPIAASVGQYVSVTGAAFTRSCPHGTTSYIAAPACRIVSDVFNAGDANVGPSFSSSLGAPGAVALGNTGTGVVSSFSVSNASHELGYTSYLTSLSLLSYSLTGAEAGHFTLQGFTNGLVLGEGQSASFQLVADGTLHGAYSVTLNFRTDQHASAGLAGQTFSYAFSGTVPAPVPEPATWACTLAGLAVLAGLRRRRQMAAQD